MTQFPQHHDVTVGVGMSDLYKCSRTVTASFSGEQTLSTGIHTLALVQDERL